MSTVAFRSKVDVWLAVVIVGIFPAIGTIFMRSGSSAAFWSQLAMWAVPGVILLGWLYWSTTYALDGSELVVRSSGLTWRVPLRDIRTIAPTHNPLSSPALSLHRLRIEYGPLRSIMVSPADRERFLEELERRRASV